MLIFPTPAALNGDLLEQQLVGAGLSVERVALGPDGVEIHGLNESDRPAAQAVVDAHPPTAQAEAQRLAGGRTNETTIRDRAAQALDTNRAFLAVASPTNAQTLAQVKALTKQNTGLIRLLLQRFDGTD